jgi:hypothetical protein
MSHPLQKGLFASVVLAIFSCCLAVPAAAQTVLWSENFDSLVLGPNVNEAVADSTAFTHDPPPGWEVTLGQDLLFESGGVEEWRGWSFADPISWASVDEQRRSEFTRGQNVIAVADSDEFDDAGNALPDGGYATFLATPTINIAGVAANDLFLRFSSSWRPEGNQTATITATYNNGAPVEVLRFTTAGDTAKPDATNDKLVIPLNNPAGATNVELEFGYFDSKNNWWWAIDELELFNGEPQIFNETMHVTIDRDSGAVTLVNNTGGEVMTKGYQIVSAAGALDEAAFTPLAAADPNWIQLSRPGVASDLSEGHLTTGTIPEGQIDLGNAWIKYPEDTTDVTFQYLDENGGIVTGPVEFRGNEGQSFTLADLNFDNAIDLDDWLAFKTGVGQDPSGLSAAQTYALGDLNGDGAFTPRDFVLFKRAFDRANGAGALAAISGAQVPEPSSWALLATLVTVLATVSTRGRRFSPRRVAACILALACMLGGLTAAHAQTLIPVLFEDFEDLPLKDATSPSETAAPSVWTDVPPAGWVRDNTTTPAGLPAEFFGWTFVNKEWWISTAGGQDRSRFTRGQGTVAVADADEYDDGTEIDDRLYNVFLSTPSIDLSGIPAGGAILSFDASWRNEETMDGILEVSYNGGTTYETLLMYDSSDPVLLADEFLHVNEHLTFNLNNPNSGDMIVRWGLVEASNDWWWAVDNVSIGFEAEPLTLEVNTTTGDMRILASTTPGASFNINSYSVTSESGSLAPGSSGGGGAVEGDFNANGRVEQADLDLVLLNWGTALNQPWVDGSVDQAELDRVLLNWGETGGTGGEGEGWLAENLSARGVDGIGTGVGENWEVLAATEGQLFEAFLFGSTLFGAGRAESLGQAFDAANGEQDLEFLFSTLSGVEIQGNVVYVGGALAGSPVPEPAALGILLLFVGGLGTSAIIRRHCMEIARVGLKALLASAVVAALGSAAHGDGLLIRHYDFESGTAGQTINVAPDTIKVNAFEDTDLFGAGATYLNLGGIGQTGLGASFDGNGDYLSSGSVNFPPSSDDAAFQDLTGLSGRGFQVRAYPNSAGAGTRQDLVLDTTQHGLFITPSDTWGFAYAGQEHDTGVAVQFDAWNQLQLVSFNGPGATLYLEGEAIGGASGGYVTGEGGRFQDLDAVRLTLGANTGTDAELGVENFYRGVLDDVKFSVYGTNGSFNVPFNFAADNDVAASIFAGVDPADVNLDGQVSGNGTGPAESDDVTALVAGWMSRNRLPSGKLAGDINTRASGDLNFDGVTDIADWAILNLANPTAGAAALSAISGSGVPEPSALVLAAAGLVSLLLVRSPFKTRNRSPWNLVNRQWSA